MSEAPTPPPALCDRCGKPNLSDEGIYSIASEFDDDGNLTSFRHWDCHKQPEVLLSELRDKVRDAQALLDQIRRTRK